MAFFCKEEVAWLLKGKRESISTAWCLRAWWKLRADQVYGREHTEGSKNLDTPSLKCMCTLAPLQKLYAHWAHIAQFEEDNMKLIFKLSYFSLCIKRINLAQQRLSFVLSFWEETSKPSECQAWLRMALLTWEARAIQSMLIMWWMRTVWIRISYANYGECLY